MGFRDTFSVSVLFMQLGYKSSHSLGHCEPHHDPKEFVESLSFPPSISRLSSKDSAVSYRLLGNINQESRITVDSGVRTRPSFVYMKQAF